MRQLLHLLIVDCERRTALVARFGSKWLLPIVTCDERVRASLASLRWAASHGIACDAAGQWLGHISAQGTDWLIVMRTLPGSPTPEPGSLCWMSLETMSATSAVIDYQRWALSVSLERARLPSVSGPFGHIGWLDEVTSWINSFVAVSAVTPYRLSASEVVLGAQSRCRRVFFKGLPAQRSDEAFLTRTLSALAPRSFARTIALECRPDGSVWWLTAGCAGTMTRDVHSISRALARLQRRLMASAPARRRLRDLDLLECAKWSSQFVDGSTAALVEEGIARVVAAAVPQSWSPLDLHPTNVLVDGCGNVRFIDVDGSFLAPAPLAAAMLTNRCAERSLYRTYEEAWFPPLRDVDWPAFELTATVVEARLAWRRFEQHTLAGELGGALELAASRTRERLQRALHRR
jgi:hypothetical protein